MKSVAYLRVSTTEQDNQKFQNEILHYANEHDLGKVSFVEEKISGTKNWRERKLYGILNDLYEGDNLIVPEMSRLARSITQIYEIIDVCQSKGIAIHCLKQRLILGNGQNDLATKVMISTFALAAEIERDLISMRTKEALKAKAEAGVKLGRPQGKGKSKLDPHREEIVALLKNGSTQRWVARHYGVTPMTVHNWLKNNEPELI